MFTRRLRNLYLALCAVFLLHAGRLVHLQVFSVEQDYEGRARSRLYAQETVDAMRGAIRDRRGVILAHDAPRFDLMADYPLLENPDPWLQRVAAVTGLSPDDLRARAQAIVAKVLRMRRAVWRARQARRPDRPVREDSVRIREMVIAHPLVEGVDLGCAAQVEAQPERFKGIRISVVRTRVYPLGRLACHLLGHLGPAQDGEDSGLEPPGGEDASGAGRRAGQEGIERQAEAYLRGRAGLRLVRMNLDEGEREVVSDRPSRSGDTVWLSLDARVQAAAEAALEGHVGAVVLMNVQTGEVIAMASSPGYDLNRYRETLAEMIEDPRAPLLDRTIKDPVAIGSIMKVAVAVGALHERVLGPDEILRCDGTMRFGDRARSCAGGYAHGDIAIRQAIEHSCNIFFFRTGLRLGHERLIAWARDLGLGHETGVDVPHEWPGRVPDPTWHRARHGRPWYPGDTLNLSIGQGDVQATPIQVAVMMAAVANGGTVLEPRLVRRITDDEGAEVPIPAADNVRRRLPLDPALRAAVVEGMARVPVSGTARRVAGLAALKVAGKTGTADRGDGRNNAWFAGFAPHDAPQVSFAVVVHGTEDHGAAAAAPVAAAVLKAYFEPAGEGAPGEGPAQASGPVALSAAEGERAAPGETP